MSEFSSENIQSAADEVRSADFGDFMFRDPGFFRRTTRHRTSQRRTSQRNTSRRNTSNRNTSRRMTSKRITSKRITSNRMTSGHRTSKHRTSGRHVPRKCFTTTQGNYQIERCFEGSNQFYYRASMR